MRYRRVIKYDYKPTIQWESKGTESVSYRWVALPILIAVALGIGGVTAAPRLEFKLPQWRFSSDKARTDQQLQLNAAAFQPFPFEPLTAFPGKHTWARGRGTMAAAEEAPDEAQEESSGWKTVYIEAGDNLSLIFDRLDLCKNCLYQILELGESVESLKHLQPDEVLRFYLEHGDVSELIYEPDFLTTIRVKKVRDGYQAETSRLVPEKRTVVTSGAINNSLFLEGQAAGLSDRLIMNYLQIFGWDIDFIHDIQPGDRFTLVYEELLKDGKKLKDGGILAAEFVNQGKVHRAFRHENDSGRIEFLSANGQSMKKAFLRTPVKYSRISSRFNLWRKHPILNRIRAHRGVDYAAPTGTPIKASGAGKVVFVGNKGGYGKTIVLDHGDKYSTLYAHMSRFAKSLKIGKTVEQGQIIGYVGSTGLATGPHLHYEFRKSGAHQDPLTAPLPNARPLSKKQLATFMQQAATLSAQLDSMTDIHLSEQVPFNTKIIARNEAENQVRMN